MAAGARGITDIFGLKSDHAAIVKDDFTTVAAAATDRLHRLGADSGDKIIEQTDWNYDENGVPTLKISQTDYGEDFDSFVDKVAPKKSTAGSTSVSAKTSENGRVVGGENSAGNAKNTLIFHYGNPLEDGKIPVTVNLVFFKKTTGARTTKGGEFIAPAVDAVGLPAKAAISIPAALLDETIVDVDTPLEFPKDYYEKTYFLTAAS